MADLSHIQALVTQHREAGNLRPTALIVFKPRTVVVRRASADEIEVAHDDGSIEVLRANDIYNISMAPPL